MTIKLEKQSNDGRLIIHINNCQLAAILLLLDYIYTDEYHHPMNAFFQIPDLCFQDIDSFTDKKSILASANQIQRDLVALATIFQLPQLLSSAQQSFSHVPVPSITDHLKSMLEKAKGTDVSIQTIEGNEAHSDYHQIILRQRCSYFGNLLKPESVWIQKRLTEMNTKRIQINLDHISKEVMDTIIQYIYLDLDKSNLFNNIKKAKEENMIQFLLEFLCEADFLLLNRLKSITEQVLVPFIKLRSATTIFEYADVCLANSLKKSCLQFITVNLPVFLGSNMLDSIADTLLRDLENYVRQSQIDEMPTVFRGQDHFDLKATEDLEEEDAEFASSLYALSRGDGSIATFNEILTTYYPEKQSSAKEKVNQPTKLLIGIDEEQSKYILTTSTTTAATATATAAAATATTTTSTTNTGRMKRGIKVQLDDLENELNLISAASQQRRPSSAGWRTATTSTDVVPE